MADEGKKKAAPAISWRAAEYEMIPKNAVWYSIIGAIALILVIVALFQKNFFFAVFLLIGTAMIFVFARRRPNVLDFSVDELGVHAGTMRWVWEDLADFSIYSRRGRLDEVIFRKNTAFNPYVRIPADDRTAAKVRTFALERLPEAPYEPTTLEVVTDWFGI